MLWAKAIVLAAVTFVVSAVVSNSLVQLGLRSPSEALFSQPVHVAVCIDQPRQQRMAPAVDADGIGMFVEQRGIARGDHPAVVRDDQYLELTQPGVGRCISGHVVKGRLGAGSRRRPRKQRDQNS